MHVIAEQAQSWFLLESDGELYIDVNCEHSFISYDFFMHLSVAEAEAYNKQGRRYLDWLSNDINFGAPILKASKSPYKHRNIIESHSNQVMSAIRSWRASNDAVR